MKVQLTKLRPELEKLKSSYQDEIKDHKRLPLYVRINTLKTTDPVATVHKLNSDFPDTLISGDPHVNFLLKFPPTTNFSKYSMYLDGGIILQDKASCLPGVVLNPPRNSVVLDACSAPGNKTLHLSALMENTGTVFAVEQDSKRFMRLKVNIQKHGATNITPIRQNFLYISPADPIYKNVSHILVDPSCSGSGMVTENLVTNFKSVDKTKVASLAELQKRLLTHALSFPGAERVVYSTCSVYEEENECVVRDVLESHVPQWEVAHVLSDWSRRGRATVFSDAVKCLRCSPQDETNGFFLACFVRKKPEEKDFMEDVKVQEMFSVQHLNMRFKLKYHYKYPYKFVKV